MLKAILNLFSNAKNSNADGASVVTPTSLPDAASLFRQAGEFLDRGDTVSSLDTYLQVIKRDPRFEKAFVMIGYLYKERGNFPQAKDHLIRAIEINPELADANYLLGSIAAAENDAEKMIGYFERSILLDPSQEHIYLELSYALFQLGRGNDAIIQIKRGLEKFPQHVTMLQYLGNFHLSQFQHENAFAAYEQALRLMPDSVELLYNFVICCMALYRFDLALDCLMRIQSIQPDHVMANFEEGMLRLQRGEYERGWRQFEWRWQTPALSAAKFKTFKPKWDGTQSLAGKTIYIRSEQGFGDTIQFCRFIPQLKELGARVVFSTSPLLFELMTQIGGVDSLVNDKQSLPDFDFYCDLMSLPLALDISLHNIPMSSRYLQCPPIQQKRWEKRVLEQGERTKIGVVWSGNPLHTNNHMRSIALSSIMSIFQIDADFTILQKEISASERVELSKYPNVFFYGEEVKDFSDTAALVDAMDIVVTVDTSVAHLSGSMGKPTWVLISCFSDWRWLLGTESSPWYDSVRLFRQNTGEPWEVIVQKLKNELVALKESLAT
ncbi:tetratricopeptide repeat protein [Undibacterium sp. LX40W]|uniref:Tetratricopeptide repeat protein n=1 Tax=Undibacterium nitidum TaxID=2762298 RepID=A0A923HQX5_9BURK|nr:MULTISPECIES: tetratricopeptide repeat protein [Undibacterium]MBC3880837.1 tetratricopeptide repeat protein [Undibacterium nitidum]MBC3890430.1 tetratricopeptide repeat protein [Undibacterium sp. LX40W]